MKNFDTHLVILLLIINLNCVLNSNNIKLHQIPDGNCIEFNNDNKKDLIHEVFEESKNFNTTYFLFFSSN
jgi:hypothetical protein